MGSSLLLAFSLPNLVIFGLLLWSANYLVDYRRRSTSFDQNLYDLIEIKRYIPDGKDVVIALDPIQINWLASSILFKKNHLYPLSNTYIEAASLNTVNNLDNPLLLSKNSCIKDDKRNIIYQTPLYTLGYLNPSDGPLHHDFTRECIPPWLHLNNGFSTYEPSGRWSDGINSSFEVALPTYLRNTRITIDLDIAPFLPNGVSEQIVEIEVNGKVLKNSILRQREKISIEVGSNLINSSILHISLRLPEAISPLATGYSTDPRLLAIRFISMHISSSN